MMSERGDAGTHSDAPAYFKCLGIRIVMSSAPGPMRSRSLYINRFSCPPPGHRFHRLSTIGSDDASPPGSGHSEWGRSAEASERLSSDQPARLVPPSSPPDPGS